MSSASTASAGASKEATPLLPSKGQSRTAADSHATEAAAPQSKMASLMSKYYMGGLLLGVIIVGTGNKISLKLMTYPMANYLYFLSVLTSLIYIPIFFGAVWYKFKFTNHITPDMTSYPKRKFAVMGFLDATAGVLVVFGSAHISGPLTVLLAQGAIPVTMVFSILFLKARYHWRQYTGALIIFAGILTTLLPPLLEGGNSGSAIWSFVFFLSNVPNALSSVYKEIAFRDQPMDAYYLNAWVALFQVGVSLIFAVPCAPVQGIAISEIPENFVDGAQCYLLGKNSIQNCPSDSDTCTNDDCGPAFRLVTTYMGFNILYNIFIVLILKFGSAALMFIASAVIIPIANICFTFEFIMGKYATTLRTTDIVGLVVILGGLIIYRSVTGGGEDASAGAAGEGSRAGELGEIVPGFGPGQTEFVRPMRVKRTVLQPRAVVEVRKGFYSRLGIGAPSGVGSSQYGDLEDDGQGHVNMVHNTSSASLKGVV